MSRFGLRCAAALLVVAVAASTLGPVARAKPRPDVAIEWVTVGDPGNPADTQVMNDGTTGYGSVDHAYRIGRFQITNAQYAAFLDAKAQVDPYQLYLPLMDRTHLAQGSGIVRSGTPGSFTYTVEPGREDKPVDYVSVFDAMRMANWLHNGQGDGDTETGAYTLLGGTPEPLNAAVVVRNPDARFFLPTEDEWYKAAFYDGEAGRYWFSPTGTDVPITCGPEGPTPNTANCGGANGDEQPFVGGRFSPVGAYTGSPSPWGTFDQGGNVFEYTETLTNLAPTCITACLPTVPGVEGPYRVLRGSSVYDAVEWAYATGRGSITAETEFAAQGFRLAAAATRPPKAR
jgi:formylglycine-generating enzyme required for sulfatase activity